MRNKPRARAYIRDLAAAGRYSFTAIDARQALDASAAAVKLALLRLIRAGELASPARGFYTIVPPEYHSLGCLPADQFIPELMQLTDEAYYVGLLSAAQYHGAAHHRPQELQIMLGRERRALRCGKVRVAFFVRKRLSDVPLQNFNTPRGAIRVSTPEATALDLVGYQRRIGGLDQVATVLSELAERVHPDKLALAARSAPIAWAQRLGYLLERAGASDNAVALRLYVASVARLTVALLPGAPTSNAPRESAWKLLINTHVEPET